MSFANQTAAAGYDSPSNYASETRVGPRSSLEMASNTFDRTVELTRRIVNLAERLCGPSVEKGGEASAPARSGVFGAIEATTRNVDMELDRAMTALNRIEAELP